MKSDYLYTEFLNVSRKLNQKLKIAPVLYGSLGLEKVIEVEFSPQDIDILVPLRFIKNEWQTLKETMEELGYTLVDLHEHKFVNGKVEIGYSFEEDLKPFAGVNYEDLKEMYDDGVSYRLLSVEDYLNVYKRALKDGYRRTKNNNKDLKKIEVLENLWLFYIRPVYRMINNSEIIEAIRMYWKIGKRVEWRISSIVMDAIEDTLNRYTYDLGYLERRLTRLQKNNNPFNN